MAFLRPFPVGDFAAMPVAAMRKSRRFILAVGALLAGFAPLSTALAAPTTTPPPPPAPKPALHTVSEVRLGVYAHDAYPTWLPLEPGNFRFDQITDVNLEVLFRTPEIDVFRWIGSPRPTVGFTASLTGKESLAHLGLTWHVPVFDTPLYLEATAGGAIHNGKLTGTFDRLRPQGCRVGFYTGLGVGANLTDKITATLSYEHMSNADLCSENFGLSNLGLRIGFKFD